VDGTESDLSSGIGCFRFRGSCNCSSLCGHGCRKVGV
jgi:hypothetical protein